MALTTPLRGGISPAAATDTTVLTQTTGLSGAVFVTITNRTASSIAIRLALRPLGAALAVGQYRLYDFPLPGNDAITRGPFSLKATDVLTGRCASTGITFGYDGWEGV